MARTDPPKTESRRPKATPAKLDFGALKGRLPNEFFAQSFCRLYLSIHVLVCDVFGSDNLGPGASPWAGRLSRRFCRHAAELARPCIDGADWDSLLRDGQERMSLIQGVIAHFLETRVFEDGLFGSSPEHQAKLEAEDEATLDMEGFARARKRASLNLAHLSSEGSMMPRQFWSRVDEVASDLVSMLVPLQMVVRRRTSVPAWGRSSLFQRLHDIVATAGWLSIGLQLSERITHMTWLRPGHVSEFRHVNVSDEIYRRSWKEAVKFRGPGDPDGLDHVARVKISVIPQITSYEPGHDGTREGMVSYAIMWPHVAYYQGWRRDDKDDHGLVSLSNFRRGKSRSGGAVARFGRWWGLQR